MWSTKGWKITLQNENLSSLSQERYVILASNLYVRKFNALSKLEQCLYLDFVKSDNKSMIMLHILLVLSATAYSILI